MMINTQNSLISVKRLLASLVVILSMVAIPSEAGLPLDEHKRCLKATTRLDQSVDWEAFGECQDNYVRPYKQAFVQCIDDGESFSRRCQGIQEELSSLLSNVEIDHLLSNLLLRVGVRVKNTSTHLPNPNLAPPHLGKHCKNPGLQGLYSLADKTIVYCNQNVPGYRAYYIDVFRHEAVHAAQHCIGGSLKEVPALKKAFFSNPLPRSEQKAVVELYEPEDVALEIEAREFNGTKWDIAILLNWACA